MGGGGWLLQTLYTTPLSKITSWHSIMATNLRSGIATRASGRIT